MSDIYRNLLRDTCVELRALALEARGTHILEKSGTGAFDYGSGRLIALIETLSMIQQNAKAFGIPLEEIGLPNIEPEEEFTLTPEYPR